MYFYSLDERVIVSKMELNESYGEQNNASQNNGGNSNCHQYCLKWNNHKLNVSGVFDRLRASQQFCDLTLSSADKRTIKCHKILLCAGSGYVSYYTKINYM